MLKRVSEIPRGETFWFSNHAWIVLEHDDRNSAVLALMREPFTSGAFDRHHNSSDWRDSSLREYLSIRCLVELAGKYGSDAVFLYYVSDLTAADGSKTGCPFSGDRIFLLSCDLFRKHHDIITPVNGFWWTLTPVSIGKRSSENELGEYVRCVCADGTFVDESVDIETGGIRPAIFLHNQAMVFIREPETDQKPDVSHDKPASIKNIVDITALARSIRAVALYAGKDPDELARQAIKICNEILLVGSAEWENSAFDERGSS